MTSRRDDRSDPERDCPFSGVDNFRIRARVPAIMPRRVRELRRRIAEGYYDRPEIVAETARRILSSGDLPEDAG
jgi:hypothetical protein